MNPKRKKPGRLNPINDGCKERILIKEVIVVEGRDDITRIKEVCECDLIATHGFGITEATLKQIEHAYETRGIIIFTDPDFAGRKIRERLDKLFPNSKHAHLSINEAAKNGDIGIENAEKESIIRALEKARAEVFFSKVEYSIADLFENGMVYGEGAREKRQFVGELLGIGYGNNKEFLKRLNNYEIKKEDFYGALQKWKNK